MDSKSTVGPPGGSGLREAIVRPTCPGAMLPTTLGQERNRKSIFSSRQRILGVQRTGQMVPRRWQEAEKVTGEGHSLVLGKPPPPSKSLPGCSPLSLPRITELTPPTLMAARTQASKSKGSETQPGNVLEMQHLRPQPSISDMGAGSPAAA